MSPPPQTQPMALWSSDPGQGWQSHQPPCPLGSEVRSAAGPVVTLEPSPHGLCSLLLLRLLPPSLFPPLRVSGTGGGLATRTAFTERRWGCQKPGRTQGSMPRALPGRVCLGPGGPPVPGLYVWPSQQELPAGPVQFSGVWCPCHTGPITAPGGLTHS